ncbi:DUF2806 domain-containing protein [Pseudomonas brassicacearum]|uniref:DUF2806 domain-containing protein n=1 Tax=Pseudomonas brassicacearum TaxID=930166 RepID=UPI0018B070CA|nr:DUF2806 domain-containing protein [Pseudomonas brassicacearum]
MEIPGEKLSIRLWETLTEKAIGGWLRPFQKRREGLVEIELKRAEILSLAQAARDAEEITSGAKNLSDFKLRLEFSSEKAKCESQSRIEPTVNMAALIEQASSQTSYHTVRKELNLAQAILHAEEKIINDGDECCSEERVGEDWIYRWRDYASDVHAEDMQRLWGQLLAGEVKAPGSYSLRCMEFLRNLEQSEAKLIERLGGLVVDGLIMLEPSWKEYFSFREILELDALGILSGVAGGGINRKVTCSDKSWLRLIECNKKLLVVTHVDNSVTLELTGFPLTGLGKQMLGLGDFTQNVEYIDQIIQLIVSKGFQVKIGDFKRKPDGGYEVFNMVKIN